MEVQFFCLHGREGIARLNGEEVRQGTTVRRMREWRNGNGTDPKIDRR